jgi:flagellar biosynthesis protein FliQ
MTGFGNQLAHQQIHTPAFLVVASVGVLLIAAVVGAALVGTLVATLVVAVFAAFVVVAERSATRRVFLMFTCPQFSLADHE